MASYDRTINERELRRIKRKLVREYEERQKGFVLVFFFFFFFFVFFFFFFFFFVFFEKTEQTQRVKGAQYVGKKQLRLNPSRTSVNFIKLRF